MKLVGHSLGKYAILEEIGRGGFLSCTGATTRHSIARSQLGSRSVPGMGLRRTVDFREAATAHWY